MKQTPWKSGFPRSSQFYKAQVFYCIIFILLKLGACNLTMTLKNRFYRSSQFCLLGVLFNVETFFKTTDFITFHYAAPDGTEKIPFSHGRMIWETCKSDKHVAGHHEITPHAFTNHLNFLVACYEFLKNQFFKADFYCKHLFSVGTMRHIANQNWAADFYCY